MHSIYSYKSYLGNNSFSFLNLEKSFESIDWNYHSLGKLWTYNITYFDFLHQDNIPIEESSELIYDFINTEDLKDAKEPFPISLRGLNWIKFFTYNNIQNQKFHDYLFNDYKILMDNLEYHLLGNHLLENGYSLLFAAYYFENDEFYDKSKEILIEELNNQILEDGAHFELTPMYHQIMLFRLLDCINLVSNNTYKNKELLKFLKEKVSVMLSWLDNITYKNGDIPLLNDSAVGIAPSSQNLLEYAKKLNLEYKTISLKDSGYKKIIKDDYECIVDVGNIGPDYIPGHAHSDTFNFEVRIKDKPFIVDTGISTYESNKQRTIERSTSSHNTVKINDIEQSEVWGGFRVAKRAKISKLIEKKDYIESSHDGYKKYGITHTRKWFFSNDSIKIVDSINKSTSAIASIHFYPSITDEIIKKYLKISENYNIKEYNYCLGFNKFEKALKIEIHFEKSLEMEIMI
ncbi:alginate lyase family protein [Poseidonibacter lekithochrous]|uniref:alginate lyase family protein n=1 Tax=Poseidonibacter lekithochrous TaxID=1904463 RepID=UPI0013DBC2B2|nr:alginate lyase family protein [Poseidonibacter lekithochrous]